jgi:hypothetical protein
MAFGDESRLHQDATDGFALGRAERCGDAIELARFVIEAKDVGCALIDTGNRVEQIIEMSAQYQVVNRFDCHRLGRTLWVRCDLDASGTTEAEVRWGQPKLWAEPRSQSRRS